MLVLGGGSAGLIAALTLKMKLPALAVTVVRSSEIGVIGVGEGTTAAFPRHFFEYLNISPKEFYDGVSPTWKLGIHFKWGRHDFYYTFARELEKRWPGLKRNTGFYYDPEQPWLGIVSACMAFNKVFPRQPDGTPHFHSHHAFHIENRTLVSWLETKCQEVGVDLQEGTMDHPEVANGEVQALVLTDGRRLVADLYVDASGFRSELLGKALQTPFISYSSSLFNDRAIIGGWPRPEGTPIIPYTIAETMDCGWCWQIDHAHWINRGYVYSSHFLSDDEALAELRRKNPAIANEPRLVKFRSGRYEKIWSGNVVAVGNSAGFVEPLEATALQIVCIESSTLADTLVDSLQEPPPTLIDLYNHYNTTSWDDIRDFLAVHFAFNTRLDTPYWQTCRAETDLAGAEDIVAFYRENGPSLLPGPFLIHPANSFGLDGFLMMLLGQEVPHAKPYHPAPAEASSWKQRLATWRYHAQQAFTTEECFELMKRSQAASGHAA